MTLSIANMVEAAGHASKLLVVNEVLKILADNPPISIPVLQFPTFPSVSVDLVPSGILVAAFVTVLTAQQAALVAKLQALGGPTS